VLIRLIRLIRRHDFLPFGEELPTGVGIRSASIGYSGDSVRQKFTGKQRDDETGLDFFEARYFSSIQGRFTSPDEFTGGPEELYWFDGEVGDNPTFYAELEEPQTLNKYVYCLNNPLRYVDPDGHQAMADALKQAGVAVQSIPNPVAQVSGRALIYAGVGVAAASNIDWGGAWNGYVDSVARGFGGDSDRPGAYLLEKRTQLKNKSVEEQLQTAPQAQAQSQSQSQAMAKPTPAPEPQPTPEPRGHRKGARKSTHDKHTKVRPGDKKPPN
jgi:RHS repeat-associated protein